MVKKIVGLDAEGNKVFERDARAYDQSLANMRFGVSIGDVLKAIPIIVACVYMYSNQQAFNRTMMGSIDSLSLSTNENAKAIGGIKDTLSNLNNYLSATTGKQFEYGRPR